MASAAPSTPPSPPPEPSVADHGRIARWLARPHPLAKAAAAVVGPLTAVIGTLLALGIISPFGSDDAIASTLEKTVDAGTAELVLDVRSGAASYTATGAFDFAENRGRLRYDFSRTSGLERSTRVDALLDRDVVFYRFPGGRGPAGVRIPADRPWARVSPSEVESVLADLREAGLTAEAGPDVRALGSVTVTDPSRILQDLRRSGEAEKRGEESLFGVATTVYEARLPGADGAPPAVAKAYIDGDDLLRRLEISGEGRDGPVTARLDLRRFGVQVDADPPPGERVTDMTDVLQDLATGR